MKVITHSAKETQQLARTLAEKYRQGAVIALIGDLGSGKTTFSQGFAKGLKIREKIISPTFIIIRSYPIPNKKSGKFFHIDLYRLENNLNIEGLGLEEIFKNPHNVTLIEWADKLGDNLPSNSATIAFKHLSENSREIEIKETS